MRVVPPTLDARLTILLGLASRRVHADVLAQPWFVRGVVPVAMQQQRCPDQQVARGKPWSGDGVAGVIGISRLDLLTRLRLQEFIEILIDLWNALESAHVWFRICQREHALDVKRDIR